MINFSQKGDVLDYTNSSGSLIPAKTVVVIGGRIGITTGDIADGATGAVAVEGVFDGVAKTTGTAWVVGTKLYWDDSGKKLTTVSTSNEAAGCAAAIAASGATTGSIKLC